MKKFRQYISIFLALAVTLTCFTDISVYAQTEKALVRQQRRIPGR